MNISMGKLIGLIKGIAGQGAGGGVKTVNGVAPDENGNVIVEQPDMSNYVTLNTYQTLTAPKKIVSDSQTVFESKTQSDGNASKAIFTMDYSPMLTLSSYRKPGESVKITAMNNGKGSFIATNVGIGYIPDTRINPNEILLSDNRSSTGGGYVSLGSANSTSQALAKLVITARSHKTGGSVRPWLTGCDLIIPSSTEGSTKMFKLVVDDSGTITATEVTG